jgi:dinuclear metal center YbgI/SA1388 family protein
MQVKEIVDHLENIAPLHLQEAYDNCGLLTGTTDMTCTGVLCTLDATEAVILEAVARGCNLVVAHHPIVFSGLKKINGTTYIEKAVIAAIKHDIAIYAIHTNLDNVIGGVNGKIAQKMGLSQVEILDPKPGAGPGIGAGIIGQLSAPVTEADFLQNLAHIFKIPTIKHSPFLGKKLQKIAICGGSGAFLTQKALEMGVDAFVTSDLKYHNYFDANGQLLLADIGHFESEQYTVELLVELLQPKFPTFAVLKSDTKTNPVGYFM